MDATRVAWAGGAALLALVVTVPAVYSMMGVAPFGIDLAYVVFGAVAVLSGALLGYARLANGDSLADHQKTLLAACLFAVAVVLVYYALAASGVVAMATLFDDGERADNFRNMDDVWPGADVEAGDDVRELPVGERPLPESYSRDGETRSIDDFVNRTETTSLVVAHDGRLVHESYYRGYDETSRATSWSVAKSYTSALVGIAHEQGHVEDLDDPARTYVPELEGTAYGNVTVRQLLTMSSGVDFDESYSGLISELNQLFVELYALDRPMAAELGEIDAGRPPGQIKEYRTTDTMVLALVLEGATGESLTSYAEDELWRPAGMEADAFWNVDATGTALGGCCLNAVPRDYARLGLLYLNDGARDGEQVVPAEWVEASTTPQPPNETGASFRDANYGYKWWLHADSDDEYMARGIYGQYVYVNEDRNVVIAKTAANDEFREDADENLAAFRAISESVAGA